MGDTTQGIRLEVAVRTIGNHVVVSEQGCVTADQLHGFILDAIERLSKGARPVDSPYVTYGSPVSPKHAGEVKVCLPVVPGSASSTTAVAATQFAYTRIVKGMASYPYIINAYEAVEAWAAANRRELCGPGREIYFGDWLRIRDDDLAVDVGFPINSPLER